MHFWQYIPPYAQWTVYDYLFHALWGLVGSLVRLSYTNAPIRAPARQKDGAFKLNAFGEVFVAAVIGMLVDTNPAVAVSAAVIAPQIVEALVGIRANKIRSVLRHWLMDGMDK